MILLYINADNVWILSLKMTISNLTQLVYWSIESVLFENMVEIVCIILETEVNSTSLNTFDIQELMWFPIWLS